MVSPSLSAQFFITINALFTIAMMILITVWNFDYGPMAKYEANALKGDLCSPTARKKPADL